MVKSEKSIFVSSTQPHLAFQTEFLSRTQGCVIDFQETVEMTFVKKANFVNRFYAGMQSVLNVVTLSFHYKTKRFKTVLNTELCREFA